jgi:hypothetical protein
MVGEIALNATSYGYSALATIAPSSFAPLAAVVLTVAILFAMFVLVTNFRRFVYGLCASVPVALTGWFSWSAVIKPSTAGNWKPFIITVVSIASIYVLIVIGKILEGTKFVKDFEKKNL